MLVQQRTISNKVSISGVGLHTGCESTITFLPAPENHGVIFRRIDVGGKPEIPALADFVVNVSRGTTLGIGDVKVHTVEHVLSAVAGLEIDNVIIEHRCPGTAGMRRKCETLRRCAAKGWICSAVCAERLPHYRSDRGI